MGLVRKVSVDSVAAGTGGDVDMATRIRQAVTEEIERRRLESLEAAGDDRSARHDKAAGDVRSARHDKAAGDVA